MMIVATILAVFIGMAVGLLGGGGSILTTPLLIYVVGFDAKQAIAASLFVVGVTSIFGLISHARAGRVVWRIGLIFGGAGMVGAFIGGQIGARLPSAILLAAFAVMMGVTAVAMIRGRKQVAGMDRPELRVHVGAGPIDRRGRVEQRSQPRDARLAFELEVAKHRPQPAIAVAAARGGAHRIDRRPRQGGIAQHVVEPIPEVFAFLVEQVPERLEHRPVRGRRPPPRLRLGEVLDERPQRRWKRREPLDERRRKRRAERLGKRIARRGSGAHFDHTARRRACASSPAIIVAESSAASSSTLSS